MNEAGFMRLGQRIGNLRCNRDSLAIRQWSGREQGTQRLATNQLHCNIVRAVQVTEFVNSNDVGMIQRRGRLGFALEAAESLRVVRYVVGQEFESNKATEIDVLCFVNNPHPSAAKLFNHAVM